MNKDLYIAKKNEGEWSWYNSAFMPSVEFRVSKQENMSIFIRQKKTNFISEMTMSGAIDELFDVYGEKELAFTKDKYNENGLVFYNEKNIQKILTDIEEEASIRLTQIQEDKNNFPDELWYFYK